LIDSLSRLSLMAWKIFSLWLGSINIKFELGVQLSSSKSSFEPLWLGSARPNIVGSTITDSLCISGHRTIFLNIFIDKHIFEYIENYNQLYFNS
jgi:hypothetical protein